jgi:RNase H-fold protein (predicted Holliday junction resolvase)
MAREVRTFAGDLAKRFPPGIIVCFADERMSSYEAEQQLKGRKQAGERLTRQRKKEQLDAVAAAVLLQQVLDGHIQTTPMAREP